MTPRHYKILDLCIAGVPNPRIAEQLSMSRSMVGIITSSPAFQHQLAIRRAKYEEVQNEHQASEVDEVKNQLKKNALAAADKLIGGLDSVDEKISQKAATEILDRTGYPKEQKLSGQLDNKPQIILTKIEINNLKDALDSDNIIIQDKSGCEVDNNTGS